MNGFFEKEDKNHQAVERALSIALCEMGDKDIRMAGFAGYRASYQVSITQPFLAEILPVLLKYINAYSVDRCVERALKIALSRKVRGWFWWTLMAALAGVLCGLVHIIFGVIVFFVLLCVILAVFLSRRIVRRIWRKRTGPKDNAKAIEEMIEMCKKSRLKICVDGLFNK